MDFGNVSDDIGQPSASDSESLERLFGVADDLLPLWIAEPYIPLAQPIVNALAERAGAGWYGYEVRPDDGQIAFKAWMNSRHGWDLGGLQILVSPSLGTSIGAALELVTEAGDRVILQPPVFTDFKPLVARAHRKIGRNSLLLTDGRYEMNLDELEANASQPGTKAMILCNPHNPVGRVWTKEELGAVAAICSYHQVFVISDEIHADVMLGDSSFTPFAVASEGTDVRWVALHGPIKTFGLAGVTDSLIVTDDEMFSADFKAMSSRFHLTRNNVFSLAATTAAYTYGHDWLDGMLRDVAENVQELERWLPEQVQLVRPEGTYLAWLDFRNLGLDVRPLAHWLAHDAGLALSPGHWFGREGAGFARMTIAVDQDMIRHAIERLSRALERLAQ